MVEKIIISPDAVRAYGNILESKDVDDFELVDSIVTESTDTVYGSTSKVFSMEVEPHISVSATNPYLLSGEVTDVVVKLEKGLGEPVPNKNVTIGQSVFIDNGTTANHNDSWNVTNGTMTRMDSYTRLVESAQTLMCQMNSGYITSTSTVEFDFKAVDGVKTWGLIYIRNNGGGNSLVDLNLNQIGGEIGEWIHLKIVFNNTDTITIYSSKLDNPITKTLSSTDSNYRLLLYGGGVNTELHFKNVVVYETINGVTDGNGEFALHNVSVTDDTTFTATYGTVSDSVDVFLCTSVDYATSNKNTNMWVLSNFTLSRGDSYSTLTRGSSTGTCTSDSSHKIAPTQTISFDLCQMDGTKYYAPIFIRNDGGGTSLANISYNDLNANVGDWVHMKIVFNNTSTITIYADTLAEPITKTLSATSTNYRLMFYGNNAITTLYFKNVAIY